MKEAIAECIKGLSGLSFDYCDIDLNYDYANYVKENIEQFSFDEFERQFYELNIDNSLLSLEQMKMLFNEFLTSDYYTFACITLEDFKIKSELFKEDDDIFGVGERWVRDPVTKKGVYIPGNMTYEEWLKTKG